MQDRAQGERGAASVEHVGLVALIALVALGVLAAVVAGGEIEAGRGVARSLAKKIACAPRLPDSCHHHPLVPAYGWPLARLVRALAPQPVAKPGPSGLPLVPVDFRRCRQESCAVPRSGPDAAHLTTSGCRTTAFTEVIDRRRSAGWVDIDYWLYRPTIGWEKVVRHGTQADVDAAAGTAVLLKDNPMLVPLEALPGRDQYDFPPGEEPPWQWHVRGVYPGWSD
jgi:hypothetical protein